MNLKGKWFNKERERLVKTAEYRQQKSAQNMRTRSDKMPMRRRKTKIEKYQASLASNRLACFPCGILLPSGSNGKLQEVLAASSKSNKIKAAR